MTISTNEITLICENKYKEQVNEILEKSNLIYFNDALSGISVKFDIEYLEVPKVIHEIVKTFAVKSINIIEIVSTTTEITFILENNNTDLAINQLRTF